MILRAALIVAALLGIAAGAQTWRLHTAQTAIAELHAAASERQAAQYRYANEWLQNALQGFSHASEAYKRGMKDAKQQAEADIAALRAGKLRLRDQWRGCQADLHTAPDSAAAKLAAKERGLRQQGAVDIVRAVSQCQAKLRYVKGRYKALTQNAVGHNAAQ